MRKWLVGILLGVVVVLTIWAGCLYSCALDSKKYNVIIESGRQTKFGLNYSVGSGVVVSKNGLILTAGHVLKDAIKVRVTLYNGREFITEVCYVDPNEDVGLIDLTIDVNDFIQLSDSNDLESGNIIYIIGNIKGVWDSSICFGRVFKNHFKRIFVDEDSEFILAKMRVLPGCSGGGVYRFNKLIGMVVSTAIHDNKAAFVVPSNVCQEVIERYYAEQSNK